jgi:NIPSNAP
MIIEIRIYQIKPGLRDRFLHFFKHESGPVQRSKGIQLLGPFIDLENENGVVYLRGFPGLLPERDRIRRLFYDGPEWKGGLKAEAMTMVDSCKVVLAKAEAEGLKFDFAGS